MPTDVSSTTDQKVPISIAPKTAGQAPATIDGVAVLAITAGLATAVPATAQEISDATAADPTKTLVGWLVSEDIAGSSTYSVTGDRDPGPGVDNLVETGTYTYAPLAATLGVSAGQPVPKV